MQALSLNSLVKRFRGVTAVDDVSLSVAPGEFVALLGPSGSGKTTLLRLLAGFEQPTGGEILIENRDVSRLPPADRNIGMVFQHYALFPHLDVRRNIEYGLRMRNWDAARRAARVDELLAMVRLEGLAHRMPRQLSGGQQQRIAIARALAYSPSIVLMDEPLGALDRNLRLEMAEEIRRIHRALRATFLYVTHDREEAMTLADRVLIMQTGKVVADGRPEDLYQSPGSEFVARFFSGMNVIDAAGLPGGGTGRLGVAPGALRFSPPAGPHVGLEVDIIDRLFLGDRTQFALQSPQLGAALVAQIPSPEARNLPVEGRVTVYFTRADAVNLG